MFRVPCSVFCVWKKKKLRKKKNSTSVYLFFFCLFIQFDLTFCNTFLFLCFRFLCFFLFLLCLFQVHFRDEIQGMEHVYNLYDKEKEMDAENVRAQQIRTLKELLKER